MRAFTSNNGLEALAALIDSDNLYLRGQVLEIILTATDCDVYDWFKRPQSYGDRVLHQNMLGFARSALVLKKLFANRVDSYPGGSFRALQIIAFLLSWMRALYTADQRLQLSPQALDELRKWVAKGPAAAPITDVAAGAEGESQADPEVQLAQALLDDFTSEANLAPTPESSVQLPPSVQAAGDTSYMLTAIDASSLAEAEMSQKAPKPAPPTEDNVGKSTAADQPTHAANTRSPPVSGPISVQELKERGNAHFKQGEYREATAWYQRAIEQLPSPTERNKDGREDTSLRAALHTNAATALWKVAQQVLAADPELEMDLGLKTASETESESPLTALRSTLADCTHHCEAALVAQPSNCKAAYRLASILLLQQRAREALEVTLSCLRVSGSGNANAGQASENSDVEVLHQMRRRCAAAVLLEESDASKLTKGSDQTEKVATQPVEPVDLGMTPQARAVLRSLLLQYQIELDLPAETDVGSESTAKGIIEGINRPVSHVESAASSHTAPEKAAPKKTVVKQSETESVKKTKKAKAKSATASVATGGTKSVAQRLQEMDDELLDRLMKGGSIKS